MLKTVSSLSIKEHPERQILLQALQARTMGEDVGGRILHLTEEEFNDIVYRWIIKFALRDFCKIIAPMSPNGYEEYIKMPKKRRIKVLKEDELIRTVVLGYRSKVIAAQYRNSDNRRWLAKMNVYFKSKGEMDKVKLIEEQEETYGAKISTY